MILRLLLHSFLLLLLRCLEVAAVATNRTIDDTFGDSVTGAKPIFLPNGNWDGPSCPPSHCTVTPSPDQAFSHTYSAATYIPGGGARTAQFSFKGTDIYIFFILANNVPNAWTETFCNFVLDGQNSGSFHHAPSQSSNYQYNALVYSRHNLPNADHTLQIVADGYSTLSFVNFDYAIYTFDDGLAPPPSPPVSPPSSPQSPTPPVTQQPPSGISSPPRTVTTVISGSTVVSLVTEAPSTASAGLNQTLSLIATPNPSSSPFPGLAQASSTSASTVVANGGASAQKLQIGAIIGGVVGGVLFLLLLLILLCLLRRRRQRRVLEPPSTPAAGRPLLTPFTSAFPTRQESETSAIPYDTTSFFPQTKRRPHFVLHSPNASFSTSSDTLRMQRQSEISHQISGLTREIDEKTITTSGSTTRWGGSEVSRIVEQNVAMKAQIEQLQAQLHSDWALGLSNDPPPGYTRRSSALQNSVS